MGSIGLLCLLEPWCGCCEGFCVVPKQPTCVHNLQTTCPGHLSNRLFAGAANDTFQVELAQCTRHHAARNDFVASLGSRAKWRKGWWSNTIGAIPIINSLASTPWLWVHTTMTIQTHHQVAKRPYNCGWGDDQRKLSRYRGHLKTKCFRSIPNPAKWQVPQRSSPTENHPTTNPKSSPALHFSPNFS